MTSLRDRLAQLTLELVAIESVTGNEEAIAEHVEAWLKARYPGEVIRSGNSVVAMTPPDGRPTIALFGHLDTVPGREDDAPRDLCCPITQVRVCVCVCFVCVIITGLLTFSFSGSRLSAGAYARSGHAL